MKPVLGSFAAIALLSLIAVADSVTAAPRSAESVAQSYVWRSWTRHDGLRGSQVWSIAQDLDGYIWLGTNEGLARFDGVRFVSGQEIGNGELPPNSVRALRVGKDGSVWIGFGGAGGVTRLLHGTVRNFTAADGLPEALITSLLEDRDGTIWAGSLNGLYRLQGERWQPLGHAAGLRAQIVDTLFEDSRGDLWIGTPSGVFLHHRQSDRFEQHSPLRIESMNEDAQGQVWGTGPDTLLVLLSTATPQPVSHPLIAAGHRLIRDADNDLWVATLGEGLVRVRTTHGQLDVERFNQDGTLSSNVVRSLLRDREGNLWIGTQNGLDRFSKGVVRSLPAADDEMSRLVRAVTAAPDGSVWVGTGHGVYRFADQRREYFGSGAGLPSLNISALRADADGTMWIATDRGIGRIVQGRFQPLGTMAGLGRPIAITTDGHGVLWVADLDRGVMKWAGHAFANAGSRAHEGDDDVARPAFSILADRQDRIWAGFVDGTVALYTGGAVRFFTEADGLTGGMVTSLYEDDGGTIWVGASSGLLRFADGRFQSLGWNRGLPGNIVGAISGDAHGALWLGVSSGLVRLDPENVERAMQQPAEKLTPALYDASDGLRGDPIGLGHPTVTRDGQGRLWFVTSDGLALLSPDESSKHRVPPPVRIEAATADERRVDIEGEPRLPPRTGNIQIDYTALSFTAPEKVRFRYRMEGFDSDWVDAGLRRQAFYTNLAPGAYRFRVVATNDGVAGEREAVWAFTLAPAFYQTRWFLAMLVLLTASGVTVAWRARVHRVRGRFSAILVERTRVAREIHDTLLQSLLGVMLQLDQVANEIDESTSRAKEQLRRLRQQVEFHIREARHSIRDLRSPVLQARDLVSALRQAGTHLTASTGVAFHLEEVGEPYRVAQRIEEHLLRIGQEAISNAVRHGRASVVRATVDYGPSAISLTVADDGVGFDVEAARAREGHWGLISMQERAEQVGAKVQLETAPGRGTAVAVTVPARPMIAAT